MDKHGERSHTVSLMGKHLFCLQMVYCGSDDYLVVRTTDDNRVIYADVHTNGYTIWPYGRLYWSTDENGKDILVDDRLYLFYERNGLLALMSGDEQCCSDDKIIDECFTDAPRFWRDEVHMERRVIKYRHDPSQQNSRSYYPHGHKTDFNCELVIVDDNPGELFKRWRCQEKCRIYLRASPDNPSHPKHQEWITLSREERLKSPLLCRFEWIIQEEPWTNYAYDGIYY